MMFLDHESLIYCTALLRKSMCKIRTVQKNMVWWCPSLRQNRHRHSISSSNNLSHLG